MLHGEGAMRTGFPIKQFCQTQLLDHLPLGKSSQVGHAHEFFSMRRQPHGPTLGRHHPPMHLVKCTLWSSMQAFDLKCLLVYSSRRYWLYNPLVGCARTTLDCQTALLNQPNRPC